MSHQPGQVDCGDGASVRVGSLNPVLPRLTSICLAWLLAACGLTQPTTEGSSGAGTGGVATPVSTAGAGAGTEAGRSGAAAGVAGAVLDGSGGGGSGGAAAAGTGAGGSGGSAGTESVPPTEVVTSAPGALWQTGTLTEMASVSPDVTVDDTLAFQTFDGFGGTFDEKSWSYLTLLSEGDRSKALKLLFGAEGARFAFGRLPIGANEFALDRYTLDITDSDTTPDLQLEKFSISRDLKTLIPYLKAALALQPKLRFLAVPWTPPVWMKTGSFTSGGVPSAYDGGNMKGDHETLSAFALYLTKYVQEYAKQGITVEAIATQREPSFAENFPSCIWSTALYSKFVRDYLGPTFAARSVSTKIYLGLMENGEETSIDTAIVSSVKGDPATLKLIEGFGFEWGMIKQMSKVTSLNLPVIQTEHLPGNFPWESTFRADKPANDFAYAVESWELIRDWLEAGATAYIAKHMALDSVGLGLDSRRVWPQNSLLVIDTATRALTVTPAYYVFNHFSHFVVPGAKRVKVTSGSLDALAFKNPDGSIVTVMYNTGGASKPVTIAVGGASYQFTIPGNGFATVRKGS